MKKIGLLGLYFEQNLGDPLMVECVVYMYKQIDPEIKFVHIDLFGRLGEDKLWRDKKSHLNDISCIPIRAGMHFSRQRSGVLFSYFEHLYYLQNINQKKRLKKYFENKIKGLDLLVVVGGALVKYRLIRDFHDPMNEAIEIAEKYHVPAYFHAVGVENGYNEKFCGCRIVKKYLNSPTVKMVTTRDDIETLKKYLRENEITKYWRVADTATWVDKIFNVQERDDTKIIGIGVITPQRFEQYEQGISAVYYEKWIKQIIKGLLKKKYTIAVFSNGHEEDQKFAEKLSEELHVVCEKRPQNYKELIAIIDNYKMVIASRLHALIIAYGLNKSIVGIDWNDKVLFFGEAIKEKNRVFKPKDKDAEEVLAIIDHYYNKGYEQEDRMRYKTSTIKAIEQSIALIN